MIRYEFRKLFQQKIGLILIITCIVIASLLFTVSDQIKEDGSLRNNAVIIQEYENIISDMSFEEAIVWLEQEYDTQSERFQKEYRESGDKSRMLITGSLVNLIDKYKYLASYDDYIKSVLNQAKQMQKVALFRDSRYVEENTERTVKDFSPLLSVEVSRDAPMFIAASTSYKIGDYILFISIIILVILIFGYEEGSDGKTLLWVQYKGKLPVFFAKLITTAISVTVLIAVYYGVILLIGHYLYREIDQGVNFSAMIQSLPEFRSCTYIISVAEYLLLFFALKIIKNLRRF